MVDGSNVDTVVTVVGRIVRVKTVVRIVVTGGSSVVTVDVTPGSVVVVTTT